MAISNELLLHKKGMEVLDLEKSMTDQKQLFQAALLTLKSKISEWTTTYDKTLLYKASLLGQAEIVVEDQPLSDKLLYQFRKLSER